MRIATSVVLLLIAVDSSGQDLIANDPVPCGPCQDIEADYERYLRAALEFCHGGPQSMVPTNWVVDAGGNTAENCQELMFRQVFLGLHNARTFVTVCPLDEEFNVPPPDQQETQCGTVLVELHAQCRGHESDQYDFLSAGINLLISSIRVGQFSVQIPGQRSVEINSLVLRVTVVAQLSLILSSINMKNGLDMKLHS